MCLKFSNRTHNTEHRNYLSTAIAYRATELVTMRFPLSDFENIVTRLSAMFEQELIQMIKNVESTEL